MEKKTSQTNKNVTMLVYYYSASAICTYFDYDSLIILKYCFTFLFDKFPISLPYSSFFIFFFPLFVSLSFLRRHHFALVDGVPQLGGRNTAPSL